MRKNFALVLSILICFAFPALALPGGSAATGPAASVYIGDAAGAAIYSLADVCDTNAPVGGVAALYGQKSTSALFDLLLPIVIEGGDVSVPACSLSDGGKIRTLNSIENFSFAEK